METMTIIIALLAFLGWGGAVVVAVRKWDQQAYKLPPFIIATIIAIAFSRDKSALDLLQNVTGLNAVTGGVLFAAWLERRSK